MAMSCAVMQETAAAVTESTDGENIVACEPYLQNPVGGGITVMWQTSVPAVGVVRYGTAPDRLDRTARTLLDGQSDWGTMHKVRIDGLTPGRKYYYRTFSREITEYGGYHKEFGDSALTPVSSFTLPEKGTKNFTAIIFNDIHKHGETLKALYSQVADVPYDFVVFNGDCIDDPGSHEEATRFLRELNGTVGAGRVPVFYVRGNHEIRGRYSVGLRQLFDYVGGKPYSAFNWGDTRFVILDCGEDKPDSHPVYYGMNDFTGLRLEQKEFLEKELKSPEFKQATRRVLIHHAPVYGLEVDYTDYNPCLELWGPLLEKAPFDVALNAHTHSYAWHPKGSIGNNYPVAVGGGYSMDNATVMVLQRRGKELTLRVLDAKGNELRSEKL